MMIFLTSDVLDQRAHIRGTHGKCRVSSLRGKLRQSWRLGLEPFRRSGFDLFNQLRDICRAGQADRKMNMIPDAADAITFAPGMTNSSCKISVERRTDSLSEKRSAIFCAEDQMNQNERKRLRHRLNYRSGLQPSFSGTNTWGFTPCWHKVAPLALVSVLMSTSALTPAFAAGPQQDAKTPAFAKTPQHTVRIRIINAQTNHPITDESLNVALRVDQIGSVAMKTNKDGIIEVDTGHATIIRILSNMHCDCRSRGELFTNYSIAEIQANGITTGNLCSNARPKAKPGELILFEIPKTYIPTYPAPPASRATTVPVETPANHKEKP